MRWTVIAGAIAVSGLLGAGGWRLWQEQLQPFPIKADADLFEAPNPEGEQAQAALQVLAPDSPRLRAFLRRQALEPLMEKNGDGYVGLLVSEIWHSRHHKRWRVKPKAGLRLQDGRILDAAWLVNAFPAWAPAELRADLSSASVEEGSAQFRFRHAQPKAAELLASAPVFDPAQPTLGTGPFRLGQDGLSISRNAMFRHGSAGFASLQAVTDPALMESQAWAQGLAAGRWAWAVFPGQVAPSDMARARNAPYGEARMRDGTVWFISRRLRRLRPVTSDWPSTRLFGVWQADYELAQEGP